MDLLPWYIAPERVEYEVNVVRECYDDRFTFQIDSCGEPHVEGMISTPSLTTTVRLEYPPYYPIIWPKVYPIPPRYNSPHKNSDFSMCLFYPSDPVEYSWNPIKDNSADILKIAFEWVFKQGYWEMTGKWPGKEAPHGGSGIPYYMQKTFKEYKKLLREKHGKQDRGKLQKP